jgi:uncharacterized protein YjbI with pentapeptide repeats
MSSCFDKEFRQLSWTDLPEGVDDFENCAFRSCDFSNADLSRYKFTDCTFSDCNLTMMKIRSASMQSVLFEGCKMLGIHFDELNPFGLVTGFEKCILNHSTFYKLNLKKAPFTNCELHECDFSECDLSGSNFSGSDLRDAKFERTNLEAADFSTAVHFVISPAKNKLKGAKFTREGLAGLLVETGIKIVD